MKFGRLSKVDVWWLVLLGAALPLAALLGLQYWALSRLENTSPAAARIELSSRARDLAGELQRNLETEARRRLDVVPGGLPKDACWDDVRALFRDAPPEGVKAYFIGAPAPLGKAQVVMYDVAMRDINEHRNPEMLAAFGAFLPQMRHIAQNAVVDPAQLSVFETDPENRVILKPVVDEGGRMIAVTGMVLDSCHFGGQFLPDTMPHVMAKYFGSEDDWNLAVTVRDETGSVVYTSDGTTAGTEEVREGLPFAFTNWTIGVRFREGSYALWARKLFLLNMTLSVVMTVAVLGALALAFRLSSREMRLSTMKSDFVSNVSHELRTPLASIRVLAEFLKLGWYRSDDMVQEYGRYIEAESTRLTRLIDNILDFSNIESGQRVYRFEVADVETLVATTVQTFLPRARSLGFEVELDLANVGPTARVDMDQFSHALLNLLDNAVKYSGESRLVRVTVAREQGAVAVSVRDFGIGIPASEREKIFERFYRVTHGLVHDVKGSGLGLSIVRHIVEAHGARMRVESEPGEGSMFTILIPLCEGEAPAAEVAVAQAG